MSGFCGAARSVPAEFVGVPAETLQKWLTELQGVLQQISSGGNATAVSYSQGDGSKSVTYQSADKAFVQQRIDSLAYALGLTPRRRAMHPGF